MNERFSYFVGHRINVTATAIRFEKYRDNNPSRPIGNYLVVKDITCNGNILIEQMHMLIRKDIEQSFVTPHDKVSFSGVLTYNKSNTQFILTDVQDFKVEKHTSLDKYFARFSKMTFSIRESRYAVTNDGYDPTLCIQPNNIIVSGHPFFIGDTITVRLNSVLNKGNQLGLDLYSPDDNTWIDNAFIFDPVKGGQRIFSKERKQIYIPIDIYYMLLDVCNKFRMIKREHPVPYFSKKCSSDHPYYNSITKDENGNPIEDEYRIDKRRMFLMNLVHQKDLKYKNLKALAAEYCKQMKCCDAFVNKSSPTYNKTDVFLDNFMNEFGEIPSNLQSQILTTIENNP